MAPPARRLLAVALACSLVGCGADGGSERASGPERSATPAATADARLRPAGLKASFAYRAGLPKPERLPLRSKLKPVVTYAFFFDRQLRNTMTISRLPQVGRPVSGDVVAATRRLLVRAGVPGQAIRARPGTRYPASMLQPRGSKRQPGGGRFYVFLERTPYEVLCVWTKHQRARVKGACDRVLATLSPA